MSQIECSSSLLLGIYRVMPHRATSSFDNFTDYIYSILSLTIGVDMVLW